MAGVELMGGGMNYFKNKNNEVWVYDSKSLSTVESITELELSMAEKEPAFMEAEAQLQHALSELNKFTVQLNKSAENGLSESDIDKLYQQIDAATVRHDAVLAIFNYVQSVYQPLKEKYAAISPVFFDIREKLKGMKKMTAREVELHINPPISQEQHIAMAESQKRQLMSTASEKIDICQDAVNLDIATSKEKTMLTEWRKYRVLLNRTDCSTAPDIHWPEKPA
ncbi:tail fiber assembly protein [Xenorhabdus sp. XENO-1]|uniref:tail fiber assembly protein n=1 Tax=Xenorhabdus bovienii TaxID=40576 RepID=UPI0020CA512A|nr:tail fiber assembly protein [Xenorhabdus bovienii]MCP9267849.1 tail fiber assembly protein [Xenorhabdus bovienii subsp. africana]